MKRKKKQRIWLYQKYKTDHPELFPVKITKHHLKLSDKAMGRLQIASTVILINVLAIMIAALLNADIRSLIF